MDKTKRPISVWIAQIVFVFYVLMMVLALLLAIITTQSSDRSFVGIMFTAMVDLIFIALSATAIWGMAARKSYGRWLGVGLLSFILIFTNVAPVIFPSDSPRPTVTIVIEILFSVFLLVLTLHVSLSDRVDEFFARKIHPHSLDTPPPPPSFDS